LVHARIGKQQGGVIEGDDAGRMDEGVAMLLLEILEERFPDLDTKRVQCIAVSRQSGQIPRAE
jgi:hypothetical protein